MRHPPESHTQYAVCSPTHNARFAPIRITLRFLHCSLLHRFCAIQDAIQSVRLRAVHCALVWPAIAPEMAPQPPSRILLLLSRPRAVIRSRFHAATVYLSIERSWTLPVELIMVSVGCRLQMQGLGSTARRLLPQATAFLAYFRLPFGWLRPGQLSRLPRRPRKANSLLPRYPDLRSQGANFQCGDRNRPHEGQRPFASGFD